MEQAREISIPDFCTVIMVGISGSGKTTFSRKHFSDSEILASDQCRRLVCDDADSQEASRDAFELLHTMLRLRLKHRRLAVVDATNLDAAHRQDLADIAREADCPLVTLVMETPVREALTNNDLRPERRTNPQAIHRQNGRFRASLRRLKKNGPGRVYTISGNAEANTISLCRRPMRSDRRDLTTPMDIIGDVHGCSQELELLLQNLGYRQEENETYRHPQGRTALFAGDLVDRGPGSDRVLEIAMAMTRAGTALTVAGNHENKLMRALMGRNVQLTHGISATLEQLATRSKGFRQQVSEFLQELPDHYWLDQGRLAVAHAGIKEEYLGRASRRIRDFCLYGDTTGETDEWGLPVRHPWAREYSGKTAVVYGHTPVEEARWLNNTMCLDTGCVFGGSLTALRWPEREIVAVPALQEYYAPVRPPAQATADQDTRSPNGAMPDATLVQGPQTISTRLQGSVKVSSEHNSSALETISRWGIHPRLMVYLPPTVSPGPVSRRQDWLERPEEVLDYYHEAGIGRIVAEEKHMGSRGVILLGRSTEAIQRRFGADYGGGGVIYSRQGRRFFDREEIEHLALQHLREAAAAAGLWDDLETDWLLLDAEIMPWSLKAHGLVQRDYAPVAAAGMATLQETLRQVDQGLSRGLDATDLRQRSAQRLDNIAAYQATYRSYCPTTGEDAGLRIAPFHLLAAQGVSLSSKEHQWHMETAQRLADSQAERHDARQPRIQATTWLSADTASADERQQVCDLWDRLTHDGGEGMVIKPMDFVPNGNSHRVQPALKVRGREYLRIIYGPDYDAPANLERLRSRGVHHKQDLASREFALGIEGLERLSAGEPLARVNQCVHAVLALESEPTDPRL